MFKRLFNYLYRDMENMIIVNKLVKFKYMFMYIYI